jgi:phage shock protein PspC (stress-responsive transcriptional regulator)
MKDVAKISSEPHEQDEKRYLPLPLRNDTMLGVCEGLSEELGINANLLRVLFGAMIFFNVGIAIGSYLALGMALAASRYFFPKPAAPAAPALERNVEASNSDAEIKIAA